jgi:hypothetical protein
VPRATHNMSHTERFELKSLPGGFVVLRRLNYEQYLERQAMAMEMRMSTTAGQSADRQIAADIKMAGRRVAEFEFAHCIADHNLTGEDDQPLNFKEKWTLGALDIRVGQEIGDLINDMNNFEGELGNSPTTSEPSSSLDGAPSTS